ncbi:MAG: putative YphP/YqiW family bacilliredoxin [Sphingobacteriales bacterium]|jgi:putative YphP/YqiW family bacilliredoxin
MSTYPEYMVAPMREELTTVGFSELKTAAEVENTVKQDGTTLVFVNSVCGCAAANARPAAVMATKHSKTPTRFTTVFAGMEKEAVDKARGLMMPYPPSSPSIALFKDGKLVHFIERLQIEGRPAELIAQSLTQAFDEHC